MSVARTTRQWWAENPAAVVAASAAMIAGACVLLLGVIFIGLRTETFSPVVHNYCGPGEASWGGIAALAHPLSVVAIILGLCAALAGAVGSVLRAHRWMAIGSALAGALAMTGAFITISLIGVTMVVNLIC